MYGEKTGHCSSFDPQDACGHCDCGFRFEDVKQHRRVVCVPEVDCMATGSNTLCEKFFSKIPQIGSSGVIFLSQELQPDTNYFCCPPVKMI